MALARMAGLSLVTLVVLAAPAHAIRYAAPAPAGSGDCSSATNACRLEAAVEGQASAPSFGPAPAGEEIVVLPGEHVLSGSLQPAVALNIHGVGQPKPTLRRSGGTQPLVTSYMPAAGIFRNLRLHGTGIDTAGGFQSVLGAYGGATYSELEVIADGGTPAAVRLSDGALLRNSTAFKNGAVVGPAIGVSEPGTSRIVGVTAVAEGAPGSLGLSLYDFGSAASETFGARVRNSIFRGGTNDVFVVGAGASNNIALQIGNSDYGAAVVAGAGTVLTDQGGNLTGTAQLTNIASGDFHQLVTSPTRNAGTTDPDLGTLDVDGQPRSEGAAPDIGADEWYVAPPPPSCDPPAGPAHGPGAARQADALRQPQVGQPQGTDAARQPPRRPALRARRQRRAARPRRRRLPQGRQGQRPADWRPGRRQLQRRPRQRSHPGEGRRPRERRLRAGPRQRGGGPQGPPAPLRARQAALEDFQSIGPAVSTWLPSGRPSTCCTSRAHAISFSRSTPVS